MAFPRGTGHTVEAFRVSGCGQVRVGDENHFYMGSLASQLPRSPPPPPSAVIPFRRDRDFIERPLLDDIVQRATEPGARIGLVGLGGVGKSQLAIEYAYRVRETNPETWVFWVHASSATRFEESYRNIAARLRLPGWNEPKADVLGIVHGWLSDENNQRWTMVVDNADDLTVMFEPWSGETGNTAVTALMARSLSDYLPLSSYGSIVVTSRSRDVVQRLQVFGEDILDVEPMEVDVARSLLMKKLKKAGRGTSSDEIVRLVKHLDCMPLAITQAAAYIEQVAPRITVLKYIDVLETNESEQAALLQKDVGDPRRDRQLSNSIIMTWHVTFTYLRQTHDSAARLLALMSLFDREAIPDDLLKGRYAEAADGPTNFEDDIVTLRAYSLIGMGVNERLFDMHRLVQLSMQKWLKTHAELYSWQERYIDILDKAFPSGDHANLTTCQAFFPHVEAMERHEVTDVDHVLVWARVLYNGAWYATVCGQYRTADRLARASLRARQEILGDSAAVVLNSMDMLALVLGFRGNYQQAEEMNRRTLAGFEKVLGVDHPDTLTSLNKLATVLRYQGKYGQAEAMNQRALAGREKILGVDHLDTLTSLNDLATVLGYRGKYSEAESMNRRALLGIEKMLGMNHPSTLTSVSTLATWLEDQGKYEEAEAMDRRALAGREMVLGVDHPSTWTSMAKLASVLQNQGKYEEAEALNRRALIGSENSLGMSHPHTLTSVSNLALILQKGGKYEQAEAMTRRALTEREKVLGIDHPDTLPSMSNLAIVLQNQGKYEEAEAMHRRALARSEKVLGVDHPTTLTIMSNLALVLQNERKYEEAEAMNRWALTESEKVLGIDHPDTLTSMSNLAIVLQNQGKYEKPEAMHRRTLAGREKVLGVNHPDTLNSMSHLALVLRYQEKYEQAEEMNRRALVGYEKVLGVDHPETLTSMSNLAFVLQDQGKYERAEAMTRQALARCELVLGLDHPTTLTNTCGLAYLRNIIHDYHGALDLYEHAIIGCKKVLGPEHRTTTNCQAHVVLLKEKLTESSSNQHAGWLKFW